MTARRRGLAEGVALAANGAYAADIIPTGIVAQEVMGDKDRTTPDG